jgi:hypothetical protein
VRAAVWLPNLGAAIQLRDEVVVTLVKVALEGATACAGVTWFGSRNGPFPRLHGRLRIEPATTWTATLRFDARYRHMPATLRLSASAESIIGHRIILATARQLLRDVGVALEADAVRPPAE